MTVAGPNEPAASPAAPAVDVVIPVYNAPSDLARCVESVLACTDPTYRLVLIDDASTDPAIGRYFAELEERGLRHVVLLRNATNLGFTGTANRGLRLGERERTDVVLLNSDTVVTRGWLAALRRCAQSSRHIGTVTPFSNNAEIASLPRFCADNPWPEGGDPEPLRAALEAAAVPTWPELPTGVGFCMLVRRDLIEGIGYLDEEAFGRGYGEENDFCVRGFRAGYRNVLCDDAFVLHLGARSFEGTKSDLARRNLAVLQQRHPHYDAMVREFIARDPLRPIREAALAQWRRATGPALGVLHIMHGHGGGTEHHARALIDATRGRCRHFLAIAVARSWQVEEHLDDGTTRSFRFAHRDGEPLSEFLGGLCATFGIGLVHLHNVSGCREGLVEALTSHRLPWGYTVHDLSFACPLITLHGRNGLYCGAETDRVTCQSCLDAQPGFAGVDVAAWRAAHGAIVAGASFLIAPSRWAAATLERYFPGAAVDVIPHGAPGAWARSTRPSGEAPDRRAPRPLSAVLLPDDGVPTVAVIGAVGPDKGARRLERLVEFARARGGSPRFVVIGYLDVERGPWQSADAVLTVHGVYVPRDLPALLAHYRVRLVAYPSAGPETFSFTLTEAWETGRPAVVPPFGALAERVGETGAGFVLDDADWRSEERMFERIVALLADDAGLRVAGEAALRATHSTQEAMAQRTLTHYLAAARTPPAGPPLDRSRVRDALGYELWWPPAPVVTGVAAGDDAAEPAREPPPADAAGDDSPTTTAAGSTGSRRPVLDAVALRLRGTALGRALAQILPRKVVAGLRARLH